MSNRRTRRPRIEAVLPQGALLQVALAEQYGPAISRFYLSTNLQTPAELHIPALAEHARVELQQLLGLLDAQLDVRKHLLGE